MVKTIENLSDDVLLEVFEYLDGSSLKSAALVCKNWNGIIGSSSTTMKKFTLQLRDKDETETGEETLWSDKSDDIMSLKRSFQSINVTMDSSEVENIIKCLVHLTARHGSQVRKLELFSNYYQVSITVLRDILRNMPLLEELHISTLNFSSAAVDLPFEPVQMNHLRKVFAQDSDYGFLHLLIGSPVKYLELRDSTANSADFLVNFLKASAELESLTLDGFSFFSIFDTEHCPNFPFKLNKCEIDLNSFLEGERTEKTLCEFLNTQASSIKELNIGSISRPIYFTIFTKFKALKVFKFQGVELPTDKEFYDNLKPMTSLRELRAYFRFPNEVATKGLLGNCPSLEILKASIEDLSFISVNNPKIKSLSIGTLRTPSGADVKFAFLEFFHVRYIENDEIFLSFVKDNPSIVTLSVRWINGGNDVNKIIDVLLDQSNLKHLKISSDCDTAEIIYDKIKVNYKSLKSLELSVHFESSLEMSVVSFEFPEDPKNWNSKCIYFDKNQ